MRALLVGVLVIVGGCAVAGDPVGRPLVEPPRGWTESDWESPRRRPVPPPTARGGTFPDSSAGEPVFLQPEPVWAEIGRGASEARVLRARGAQFMEGIELVPSRIPLRETVWSGDAYPVEAGDSMAVFTTPWVRTWQLRGDVRCDLPSVLHYAEVRLVGSFRARGDDLVIESWMEPRGSDRCVGREGLHDRVRAFSNDLELFARSVVRRAMPAPVRRP